MSKNVFKTTTIKTGTNTTKSFTSSSSVPSVAPLIFGVIFLIFFLVAFIKGTFTGSNLTFTGFLNFLSDCPRVFNNFSLLDFTITGDWGLFDGFRNFLNIFTGLFSIIVFACKSLINVLGFVIEFFGFLLS